MNDPAPTIHASAVLVGPTAVLIRGPSGSGKSSLAAALIAEAARLRGGFARLVGDDRVYLEPVAGRLLVRPHPELAGLIEIHGLGLRRIAHESVAVVGYVVDLEADDATRLPQPESLRTMLSGVKLPRLPIGKGLSGAAAVRAWLGTEPGTNCDPVDRPLQPALIRASPVGK